MDCIDPLTVSSAEYLHLLDEKASDAGIPIRATIELTERCNLHCVHCYLGDQENLRPKRAEELSTDHWLGMIDQITDLGCLYLLITGGDPMLRKDFATIYTHAKRRGLLVTVFTNGTLVTDAILDLFRELPPFIIEITLYGATKATYEAITGVPGSYERCIQGIERLRGLGLDVRLKTILMRQNAHEFGEIADYCRANSTDGKFRSNFEIQECLDGDKTPLGVCIDPEVGVAIQMSQPDHAAVWEDYYTRRRNLIPTRPNRLYACGAGLSMFHIGPYGQMQPCLTARHFSVDVNQSTLSAGLKAIRQRLAEAKAPRDSTCTACPERMVCSSCPAHAYLEKGSEEDKSEYNCQVTHARSRAILPRGMDTNQT